MTLQGPRLGFDTVHYCTFGVPALLTDRPAAAIAYLRAAVSGIACVIGQGAPLRPHALAAGTVGVPVDPAAGQVTVTIRLPGQSLGADGPATIAGIKGGYRGTPTSTDRDSQSASLAGRCHGPQAREAALSMAFIAVDPTRRSVIANGNGARLRGHDGAYKGTVANPSSNRHARVTTILSAGRINRGITIMRRLVPALLAAAAAAMAMPAAAATLVSAYAVPNGTDLSGLSGAGQNRLDGFGSDLIYDAGTGVFQGITDRGPGGGVLPYAPRLQSFTLDIDRSTGAIGGFALQATTLFRQANGQTYTGLNPQLSTGSAATQGASLDPEGLARLPNGNLLVSDEYGPSVYEFTPAGAFVRAFEVPANLVPRQANGTVDYVSGRGSGGIATGRQDNRGFEGLTVSPDGKTAYAILQDPLVQEGQNTSNGTVNGEGRFSRNVRIVAYDVATGTQKAQYVYQLESLADINGRIDGTANDFAANAQGRSIGVSSIQAVGDGTLLVLERDNRGFGVEDANGTTVVGSKRVFRIDLAGATDVKSVSLAGTNTLPAGVMPVAKTATPFLDIAAALRQMGIAIPEKLEGFTFGPRLADGSYTLIMVTDNDFSVTQNGAGTQFDVCTSGVNGSGTSQQVALGAACPAGMTLIPNMIYSFRLSEAEYRTLTGAVPEPATWGMMVLGFGLVGAAARRRRRTPMLSA